MSKTISTTLVTDVSMVDRVRPLAELAHAGSDL